MFLANTDKRRKVESKQKKGDVMGTMGSTEWGKVSKKSY